MPWRGHGVSVSRIESPREVIGSNESHVSWTRAVSVPIRYKLLLRLALDPLFMWGFRRSSRLSQPSNEAYEFLSSSDQEGVARVTPADNRVLTEDDTPLGRSSSESSATSTPSRAPSPSPLYPSHRPSSSISGGGLTSPLLFNPGGMQPPLHGSIRNWWNLNPNSRRRRSRERTVWRTMKKAARRTVRHPLFPRQPLTIVRMRGYISFPY